MDFSEQIRKSKTSLGNFIKYINIAKKSNGWVLNKAQRIHIRKIREIVLNLSASPSLEEIEELSTSHESLNCHLRNDEKANELWIRYCSQIWRIRNDLKSAILYNNNKLKSGSGHIWGFVYQDEILIAQLFYWDNEFATKSMLHKHGVKSDPELLHQAMLTVIDFNSGRTLQEIGPVEYNVQNFILVYGTLYEPLIVEYTIDSFISAIMMYNLKYNPLNVKL